MRLHDVIVRVLRKRPKFAYFQVCLRGIPKYSTNGCIQGYHDIISVLMLTIAPPENGDLERLESAAEKLSLHRLRDAMGQGLEPLLGMMRWALYYFGLSFDSNVVQVNEASIKECGS